MCKKNEFYQNAYIPEYGFTNQRFQTYVYTLLRVVKTNLKNLHARPNGS